MRKELGIQEILKILPHKWPFLFVDKVTDIEPGKRGIGIKNVTISEPYFEGHFPQFPIMPGVLIVEAAAQTAAVIFAAGEIERLSNEPSGGSRVSKKEMTDSPFLGYLSSIKKMKFKKPVAPGDQLKIKVRIGASLNGLTQVIIAVSTEKETVAEGEIIIAKKQ
ncbi:3-hydroxyacyl-ACP dehydratase FabZ [Metabacillus malikii]|uniref:3-hydroxyacyl-[acyl-carrier-protein] dehydratase n=1 Tax=Metabacillus malikii TaxID=1504265 RepID=A0ABT9ZA15_9BACI|nr:3-hydroxyacyl-ACP dehydratase FabZ [Metabacillus malikii]MDQ0229077.1 3-hydroxyacyl-[acyl-carrier-protein] dehydratase [Metabacillus malikii]